MQRVVTSALTQAPEPVKKRGDRNVVSCVMNTLASSRMNMSI